MNKFGALTKRVNWYLGTERQAQQHVEWTEACGNSRVHRPMTRGTLWIEPQLSLFVFSLSSLLLGVSVPWLFVPCSDDRTLHWLKGRQGSSSHSSHISRACPMCHLLCVLVLISSTSPFTSSSSSPSLWSTCSSYCPTTSTSSIWWTNTLRTSSEDLGTLAENEPPTGLWTQRPLHHRGLCRIHPGVLGRAAVPQWLRLRWRHHRQDAPWRVPKTSRSLCRRLSVIERGDPVVCSLGSQVSSAQETQRHNSESEKVRTLLDRQREQILADCHADIRKHEFQADYDRRSIQKLNEMIELQKEEICRAHQGDERHRQDQQLLHWQLLKQNWDLREAHENSLKELEDLKKFQSSTFDTITRRRLVEDQDTVLELTGKIQELQNEINCMNDSRDFQYAESVRSGHSLVTSQPVSFPPHPAPGGMLSSSIGMPSRKEWAAKHLGHTWYIGQRFCKSSSVFFSTLSAGVESM